MRQPARKVGQQSLRATRKGVLVDSPKMKSIISFIFSQHSQDGKVGIDDFRLMVPFGKGATTKSPSKQK